MTLKVLLCSVVFIRSNIHIHIDNSQHLVDEFITPPRSSLTRKKCFSDTFDKGFEKVGILPSLASWLWSLDELQQKKVFPRLTKAAVSDSQENLHLIKISAALSLSGSRAGLVSFELGKRSLTVT